MEAFAPVGERMTALLPQPVDPQLQQEMYSLMFMTAFQGYMGLVYADPEHPDFIPVANQVLNIAFPNPDNVYYMTPLDENGVYKLSGDRGTVRIIDFNIGSGPLFRNGTGWFGPTLAEYDLDKRAHIRKDGSFDVLLSVEKPKGYKGDWWPLPKGTTTMTVRQISYDWLHEVDGRLAIERVDKPFARLRPTAAETSAALAQIPVWMETMTKASLNWMNKLRAKGMVNKMDVQNWSGAGGIATQRYIEGLYDLQPDEALIIETEVPKTCRYWGFQLADDLWKTTEYVHHQVSLNGFQARLDRDGKFRAVVSNTDPGVPNWLDTAGYLTGMLYGRWNGCSSFPQPQVTKVKLAEVRENLPKDTPVVTAEARDATLRLRRKAMQMRRRW